MKKFYPLPFIDPSYIENKDYFFLFETALFDRENFRSFIFIEPKYIIKVNDYDEVEEAFKRIEDYSKKCYLVGYFSYELGYYFEKSSFKIKDHFIYPLIHLCVFDKAIIFDHRNAKLNFSPKGLFIKKEKKKSFYLRNLRLNITEEKYIKKINRIKDYIKKGDTYQVNFTNKFHFDFKGSAFSFYQDLKNKQSVSYACFSKFKDEYVISLSPELFFKRKGLNIYSKPMKGTIERGKTLLEDKKKIEELKASIKNRAENLMIVDLVRNDLNRICKPESVKVINLFTIEKYPTLFQMTSLIKGELLKGITYFDIFKSIFPGGSVTGAPKIRTMQIIRELEKENRNVYCGALGIIFPKNKAIFNLPIRTISLIKDKGQMGVGGGIVIDSSAHSEFKECLLKAKFLTEKYKPFHLLETIGFLNGRYRFLKQHLRRLKSSANYFDFYFDYKKIISLLIDLRKEFKDGFDYKVRLLLDKEANIKLDYSPIFKDNLKKKYIAISKYRTDPKDLFLYHKTTCRNLYDSEYRYYSKRGYFDVIFLNTYGEVTEGAISNIIIEKNKILYTPALSSGLLPGIYRDYLIKKYKVRERVIFLKDLINADRIFLCNSVRGLNEVFLK